MLTARRLRPACSAPSPLRKMSSLNATQADGYYAPPEYYESGAYKKQSISQFAGSKGHNQYLQRSVVRFELPYDGFCTKCSAHVGKGTRFNAHKSHADNYFTTKIWEFTTRCRACGDCTFKIRTNPKGRCFDYVEGIRRKVEEFDTQQAGTEGVIDTDVSNGIIPFSGLDAAANHDASIWGSGVTGVHTSDEGNTNDDLSRLERTAVGERKAQMQFGRLESIQRLNDATSKDDAASNAAIRATYRKARQGKKRRLGEAARIGLGHSIELAQPMTEDISASKEAFGKRQVLDKKARKRETNAFKMVRTGSIFGKKSSGKSPVAAIEQEKNSRSRMIQNNTSTVVASAGPSPPVQETGARSGAGSQNRSNRRNKRLLIKPPLLHFGDKDSIAYSTMSHRGQIGNSSDDDGRDATSAQSAFESTAADSSALSALAAYGSASDSD